MIFSINSFFLHLCACIFAAHLIFVACVCILFHLLRFIVFFFLNSHTVAVWLCMCAVNIFHFNSKYIAHFFFIYYLVLFSSAFLLVAFTSYINTLHTQIGNAHTLIYLLFKFLPFDWIWDNFLVQSALHMEQIYWKIPVSKPKKSDIISWFHVRAPIEIQVVQCCCIAVRSFHKFCQLTDRIDLCFFSCFMCAYSSLMAIKFVWKFSCSIDCYALSLEFIRIDFRGPFKYAFSVSINKW